MSKVNKIPVPADIKFRVNDDSEYVSGDDVDDDEDDDADNDDADADDNDDADADDNDDADADDNGDADDDDDDVDDVDAGADNDEDGDDGGTDDDDGDSDDEDVGGGKSSKKYKKTIKSRVAAPVRGGGLAGGANEDSDDDGDSDDDDDSDDGDDDSDEDDTADDKSYLQKFKNLNGQDYIASTHPELIAHNLSEIQVLSQIIRKGGVIADPLHRTMPFLTKYERARILGQRTKQLEHGSDPYVDVPSGIIDEFMIAKMELAQKKIPFIIKRPLPNGLCEYWRVVDLEIVAF